MSSMITFLLGVCGVVALMSGVGALAFATHSEVSTARALSCVVVGAGLLYWAAEGAPW